MNISFGLMCVSAVSLQREVGRLPQRTINTKGSSMFIHSDSVPYYPPRIDIDYSLPLEGQFIAREYTSSDISLKLGIVCQYNVQPPGFCSNWIISATAIFSVTMLLSSGLIIFGNHSRSGQINHIVFLHLGRGETSVEHPSRSDKK